MIYPTTHSPLACLPPSHRLQLSNGDLVKVEEIALLSVTAVRGDGRRLYIPTSRLIADTTINLSRSDTFWDNFTILVDASTPASVLEVSSSLTWV